MAPRSPTAQPCWRSTNVTSFNRASDRMASSSTSARAAAGESIRGSPTRCIQTRKAIRRAIFPILHDLGESRLYPWRRGRPRSARGRKDTKTSGNLGKLPDRTLTSADWDVWNVEIEELQLN